MAEKVTALLKKLESIESRKKKLVELEKTVKKQAKEAETKYWKDTDNKIGSLIRSYYQKNWEGINFDTIKAEVKKIASKIETK